MLRRRDVLRLAALGAAAAATGCPSIPDAAPRTIGGKVHGFDEALAHVLRAGDLARRAPDQEEPVDVLIVGAGVAGLTCAWRLRREGVTVRVVEVGDAPGGNARSGANEVSPFPWGAHYLRVPTVEHRALVRFLEEVGVVRGRDARGQIDWDTRAVVPAPHERLWEGGLWGPGLFPPPRSHAKDDAGELARFQALVVELSRVTDGAGRRAFALPLDHSARTPELLALDRLSFASWLEQRGLARSPAVRWLLEYGCRDDYGCTLETTSAWAGLHYHVARESDDPSREVTLAWPEGNGRLVRLLAGPVASKTAGALELRGRAVCVKVEPGAAPGATSRAHVWYADQERLVRHEAKHLVWAGPQLSLARALPAPPPWAAAFTYAPWLVANLTLDVAPGGIGAPLAWDNVFYGKPSLGYVVASRGAPAAAPQVVTWYLPLTDADPAAARRRLLALDHPAIVDLVRRELDEVHPTLVGRLRSVDAWRWGHALIRPVPGFIWGEARAAALARQDALLVANSDLSGLPVFEEAFYRGVVAGEEVLRRSGRAFQSLL